MNDLKKHRAPPTDRHFRARGRVIERTALALTPSKTCSELVMRDVDVLRLLRDDGDGEAGARSPPKTPENSTSERMADNAPAWEDAHAAKAKGDAHFKVRAEPSLDRCLARVHRCATRFEPRTPRGRPASTAPPVSRDGPSPQSCRPRDARFFQCPCSRTKTPSAPRATRRRVVSPTPTPRTAERSCSCDGRTARRDTKSRRTSATMSRRRRLTCRFWKPRRFPIAR